MPALPSGLPASRYGRGCCRCSGRKSFSISSAIATTDSIGEGSTKPLVPQHLLQLLDSGSRAVQGKRLRTSRATGTHDSRAVLDNELEWHGTGRQPTGAWHRCAVPPVSRLFAVEGERVDLI